MRIAPAPFRRAALVLSRAGTSPADGVLALGPCQQTDLFITGNTGMSAEFMGLLAGGKHQELKKKHTVTAKSRGRSCTCSSE